MCIQGEIQREVFQMIVDTGSTITLMNKSTWLRLKSPGEKLKKSSLRLSTMDGTETASHGSREFVIRVAGIDFRQKIEVTDCEDPVVLGMDFIKKNVQAMDFERLLMRICSREIPMTLYQEPEKTTRIVAAEGAEVPAASELIIHGTDTEGRITEGLLEMEQHPTAERPWLVARALVRKMNNRIPVRVINPLNEPIQIRPGAYLGTVHPSSGYTVVPTAETSRRVQAYEEEEKNWMEFDKLRQLGETAGIDLEAAERSAVSDLLYRNKAAFSNDDGSIGQTNLVQHGIDTRDQRPIKQAPRRIPEHYRGAVDELVNNMLDQGIIEESTSPWASPIVLVKKKDGSLRFCIDYRKLNAVTVKDAYPLPRIDDTITAFKEAKWFSTLDLTSGYWQVGLTEDARKKSAFCIPGGLYQFKVMSFGLCNAPGTFERLMERVLAGLSWKSCLLYLDDIIIYSQTFAEHQEHLQEVFNRLVQAGLKLKPSKCQLFQAEVNFLGHIIGRSGVRTDPEKTEAVRKWARPQNVTDVRSFLGLCSYYRKFVKGFAEMAVPLHQLTQKKAPFLWGKEQQEAFDQLKDHLVTAPILGVPKSTGRFILDTDASDNGLGAVLSQEQDGQEKVLMYLSRSLTKEERRYCVTRRELLAVVYAVRECKHYLLGRRFLVRTDHGCLTWLMNFKEPQGQVARWIELLSEYDFEIQHRPGKKHQNADALSRDPCAQCGKVDWKEAKIAAWEKTDTTRKLQGKPQQKTRKPEAQNNQTVTPMSWLQQYSNEEVIAMQEQEEWYDTIKRVVVEDSVKDVHFPELSRAAKTLFGMRKQLRLIDGALYREWLMTSGTTKRQLIAPAGIRREVFRLAHTTQTGGHLGNRRMMSRIKQRYFWPGMGMDIRQWILSCDDCASRSTSHQKKMQMQKYRVGNPMERVAMDIMGPLPRSTRGNQYILVVGDYFTKWIEAYPLPNQEAKTVADVFTTEFIARYGAPLEIHTDQGRNFEAALMKDVCKILGITKTRTTAFRPQSDGFVERFNRTLQQMISLFVNEKQTNWDRVIPMVLTAYRATPQETTGQSPNMLMLGREITLPVDLVAGPPPGEESHEVTEYGAELRNRMEKAFEAVRRKAGTEMNRQKKLYDRKKVDPATARYKPGDAVWQAIKARKRGRAPKLQRRWKGPRLVIQRYTDVTYLIADGTGQEKVVHFDMLKAYHGEKRPRWLSRRRKELEEEAAAREEKQPETSKTADTKTSRPSGDDDGGVDSEFYTDEDSD